MIDNKYSTMDPLVAEDDLPEQVAEVDDATVNDRVTTLDSMGSIDSATQPSRPNRGASNRLSLIAWIPVPFLLAAITWIGTVHPPGVYEHAYLLTALNLVFRALVSVVVAYLIGRSFRKQPEPGLLLIGTGAIAWGAASITSLLSAAFGPNGASNINAISTSGSICIWLSAFCFLTGSCLFFGQRKRLRYAEIWLAGVYTAIICAIGVILVYAHSGWVPSYFIQGYGGTPIRGFVIGSATGCTAVAALLLHAGPRSRQSSFQRWYSIALALAAVGLFASMIEVTRGDAMSWIGRASQLLAGVYMLVAAFLSVRESGSWTINLQDALEESDRRYRSLFNEMTEGFALHEIICDDAGKPCDYRFLDVNPAFERLTGLRRHDVVGATVKSLLPDDDPRWVQIYGQVALTGKPFHFDNFSPALKRHYEVYAYCPGPGQFAVIFTDVSARKQTEHELRLSEEHYRQLHDTMGQGVVYHDTEGAIISMNPAAERILGKTWLESNGDKPGSVQHQTIHEDGKLFLGIEHPVMVALRTGKTVQNVVMGVFNPRENRYRWIEISAVPVFRAGESKPHQVYAIFDDITARKNAEEQLRASEARAKSILNAVTESVWLLDTNCRIVDTNPAALGHLADIGFEDLIGKPASSILPADIAASRQSVYEGVIRDGIPSRFEDTLDGLTFDHSAYPVRNKEGVVTGVTVFSRNITQRKQAELAVQESEAQFRSVLDSSLDCIYRYDLQARRFEYISPVCESITGYTWEELAALEGDGYLEMIHPDDRDSAREAMELALETGLEQVEYRQRTKAGDYRFISNRVHIVRDADARPIYRDGNIRDITLRKQAQQDLHESEARFRAVLENSLDCIYRFNLQTWRYEYMSPSTEQVMGYTAEEMSAMNGEDIFALLHPDDYSSTRSALERVAKTGHETVEYRIRVKSGDYRWQSNNARVTRDPEGRPLYRYGCVRDITDRKVAELAVVESETRLKLAIAASRAIVYDVDVASGRVISIDGHKELLGIEGSDEIHDLASWAGRIHPDDFSMCQAKFATMHEHREHRNIQYRVKHANGHYIWLDDHATAVEDDFGHVVRIVGTSVDITDRKRAEDEANRLNRMRIALTNSSHVMNRAENEVDFLREVCRVIVDDCGYAMVWIGYAEDDEAKSVRPVASAGFDEGYLESLAITWADTERGRGPTGTAVRTGKPIVCGNFLTEPKFEPWRKNALARGYASSAVQPLISDGKTCGAITIYSRDIDPFTDAELELLSLLADDLSYGITAIRLRDQVRTARAAAERQAAEWESFVSNLADGVTMVDIDGQMSWINNAGREILHMPPNANVREWRPLCNIRTLNDEPIPPDQTPSLRALKGERVSDYLHKFITPTGETFCLSTSTSPVFNSQGGVIGATSTFRDQSERIAFERDKQILLDREHKIADMLQEALIPSQFPDVLSGCRIAAKYVTALDEASVGGDFYDVFELDQGRIAILIGDVAGKGLAAAMQVSAARHAFRSYAYTEDEPGRVIRLVNDAVCKERSDEGKMLTAFFGIIDARNNAIIYSIAGHEPPIIRRPDGDLSELNPGGIPLGVYPGVPYPQWELNFDPGDTLVMFTDGITEARSEKLGMFGKSGLFRFLGSVNNDPRPSELVESILDKAREYGDGMLKDDVAIVAIVNDLS